MMMNHHIDNQNLLILVIEDEPEIAEILQVYLQHEGFRTQHANNGRQGIQFWRQLQPDLVLLDIRMPGHDGLDILQTIRSESNVPIIMLTALTDDITKLLSLRLGADDYIAKPFNPAEVIARIKTVLRRSHFTMTSSPILRIGRLTIDQNAHTAQFEDATGGQQELPLTLTEFKLLVHLARQPKRCFSRMDLIEACLPESDALDRVIDSHLSKLRRKLSDAGGADMIQTVRGVGYRLWID
ncbi:MAG: response regulator transcription factor [Gammaproteobacteria bacterium]|nr:response regulator transcription factor [Gammaproteobacteria bacterium]